MIEKYFKSDENDRRRAGPPSILDWEIVEVLVKFLGIFNNVTMEASSFLPVTSHMYCHSLSLMYNNVIDLSLCENKIMRDMTGKLLEKFNRYWGSFGNANKLIIIGVVLDLRYKLDCHMLMKMRRMKS